MSKPKNTGSLPVTEPPPPELGGRSGLGHLPGLDGLRGVAVLSVLLFHGGVSWLPGGFLGVDVFFVLSGFLITSLLLDELARTDRVGLGNFWMRRVRRLLPALLVLLGGTALYAWLVAAPEARNGIRVDVLSTLGYFANWHFIANQSSYFARTGAPSPLAHTWSLAIEEQFYVVWPLLVWLLGRGRHRLRNVGLAAAAGWVASAAAMATVYRSGSDPSRVYYGTDTRAQVLMIGALVAVGFAAWRRSQGAPKAGGGGWATATGALALPALAALGWGMVAAAGTDGWIYRGGLTALSVAVAVVVAAVAVAPASPVARALGAPPLRWVGLISYGMYLYHWPLFLVLDHARTGLLGPALLAVRMGATVAVSVLSYLAVEMPVRRGLLGQGWGVAALPTGIGAVVAATVAATTLPVAAATPVVRSSPPPPARVARVVEHRPPLAPGAPVPVMFVGDSVAETLGVGMQPLARPYGVSIDNRGELGCGIVTTGPYEYFGNISAVLPQCLEWETRWRHEIERDQPDVVFLVVGRWEVMNRTFDGQWTHLGDPVFDAYVRSQLERAIDILSSQGAVVALATAPYYLRGERPDGGRWPEDDPARVDDFNRIVRSVAARHPQSVVLVDLGGHTAIGDRYTPYIDGIEMRYDGVHFTPRADRWLAPWLLPQLAALGPARSAPGPAAPGGTTPTTARSTGSG